jgi:flagellar basal-body rod protein FlgF
MIRALYTAASGMLFGMRQQDIAADNLANTRTAGFKAETSAAGAFSGVLARRVHAEQAPIPIHPDEVLGVIGTGVYQAKKGNDFTAGAMRTTDEPLDLAIAGPGFFAIQTADGVQYTRDGHFGRDVQNQLVTAQGLPVLDANDQPIILDTDHVRVKPTGELLVADQVVAQLQVVDLDPVTAIRAGANRFQVGPGTTATPLTLGSDVSVTQGTLEEANVNAARTASDVLSVSRAFEASQHIFTTINDTLEKAVEQIGRVSG